MAVEPQKRLNQWETVGCMCPPLKRRIRHGERCSLVTANVNDSKSHSKEHGELISFPSLFFFVVFPPHTEPPPRCHTCSRAEEHNVTFRMKGRVRKLTGRVCMEEFPLLGGLMRS